MNGHWRFLLFALTVLAPSVCLSANDTNTTLSREKSPRGNPISDLGKADNLPELGTPSASSRQVAISGTGASIESRNADDRIAVRPEYSKQTGLSVGLTFATYFDENKAIGLLVTGGRDKQELLFNLGLQSGPSSRFILTAGQLGQRLQFYFPSGDAKAQVSQTMGALQYQRNLDFGQIKGLEGAAYLTHSPSRDLADRTYVQDTPASYEIWNDPRRIAGANLYGLKGKISLSPVAGSLVKLGLGAERLSYDYLNEARTIFRATTSGEWQQSFDNGFVLRLSGDQTAAQRNFGLELRKSIDSNGQLALGYSRVEGRDGAPSDNRLSLTFNWSIDGRTKSAGAPSQAANRRDIRAGVESAESSTPSLLLEAVSQRPSVLPSQVVATRDYSAAPTRILSVTKAGLPAGTTFNANGTVTVVLPHSATAIAGVTLNAVAIANTAFSASGTTLTIDTSKIAQPAVGVTDTYVVTTNSVPADAVTILVQHGSILIKQITINAGVAGTFKNVYGDVCATVEVTPDCTFNLDGSRVNVSQDPNYNRYGFGSDDLWYVKFYADGTADIYNNIGIYQYTSLVSTFAGWVGGNTIGVGTTGLYWENVSGGTYWLGKNGVLYSANAGEANFQKAIN